MLIRGFGYYRQSCNGYSTPPPVSSPEHGRNYDRLYPGAWTDWYLTQRTSLAQYAAASRVQTWHHMAFRCLYHSALQYLESWTCARRSPNVAAHVVNYGQQKLRSASRQSSFHATTAFGSTIAMSPWPFGLEGRSSQYSLFTVSFWIEHALKSSLHVHRFNFEQFTVRVEWNIIYSSKLQKYNGDIEILRAIFV